MEEQNIDEQFEVRDLRKKSIFILEDEFFNGYVKILGTNALGVYCSLCRHADKKQKCYPSQSKIAEELNLSEPTINEWIKVLEYFKIIKKQRIGKQCTNRYWLLDKKIWRKDWEVILNELSSPDFKQFKFTTKTVLVHDLNSLSSNRKELQKKGITKERIILHSDDVAGKDINLLINKFKPINPSYEKFYKNITQRGVLERLVKKYGLEKVGRMIDALPSIITQQYAPQITSPLELENKLAKLIIFVNQQKSKVGFISLADYKKTSI